MSERKLSVKNKISYGAGCICDNTLYTLSGTYLMLYLTTVAGVEPAAAGAISAVGSVWEAIVGPFFGYSSDNMISRLGKRKPFLLFAAIPVAVVTSLLFTTINAGPAVKAIYYTAMILLYWTFFSMEFVPYMSWGADLAEKPTIIVDWAMNAGRTGQQSWQLVGMFCGTCAGLALLISALTLKKGDRPKDDPEIKRLKAERRAEREAEGRQSLLSKGAAILREYFSILKLRSMRYLLLVSMLYLIANTIFSSDRVFFMTYNLGMSQKTISAMMLLITLSGIAFVPFIERLSRRLDKKNVFMLGIGLAGVLLILMRFVPTVGLKSVIAVSLFYSVANTCYWQLMPSMIYDIAEIDEIVTGESHAGSVISFQALSESVCIAIGLQALGIILSLSGFDETQPSPMEAGGVIMQPESALTWVSHSFTLIPGIFMVLVFLVMLKYPVTQEKLKKLREEKMLK